jgi:DNA gyrase subunit B
VSVKLGNPQFEGQTKTKLQNSEVEGILNSVVYEKLMEYFEEHPAEAKNIALKAILGARSREAARKARELTRRKSVLESGNLPGKLADAPFKTPARPRSFWWRETPPAVRPRWGETAPSRPFCRCGARC